MSRIFGVFDRGSPQEAPVLAGRLAASVPPVRGGGRTATENVSLGPVSLGLAAGAHSYASGLYRAPGGDGLAVWCGYLPRLGETFTAAGLPADGQTGDNLLALYRERGPLMADILPGRAAVALYDARAGRLFAACDRGGFFPLFLARPGGRLVFASSVAMLREAVLPEAPVNRAAVAQHLFFDAQCGATTWYEGIENLPYGTWIEVDTASGEMRRGRYFSYENLFDIAAYREARSIDSPEVLRKTFDESIGRIMDGRDPGTFGLLCGGGIDCSFAGAVLHAAGYRVPMFCAWISDVPVHEADQAREVGDSLGAEVIDAFMPRRRYYPLLLRNIVDLAQPAAHPNLARVYILAETVRAHGRPDQILGVASDLLFGGTGNVRSLYRYQRLRRVASVLPARARTLLGVATADPAALDLVLRMRNPLPNAAALGMGEFSRAATQQRIREALSGIADPRERAVKILMVENLCDYQEHLLQRRYEFTAREGISYYFPFLDTEVVRFAINLPVRHCIDWGQSKLVVRRALGRALGGHFARRKKWGGDIPIELWVAPLAFLLRRGFVSDHLGFDAQTLLPVIKGHHKLLWNLLDIELWGRLCVQRQHPEEILELVRGQGIECDPWDG
jgi:asparagine synthase (glutamine-hydrolysing)